MKVILFVKKKKKKLQKGKTRRTTTKESATFNSNHNHKCKGHHQNNLFISGNLEVWRALPKMQR